MLDLKLTLVKAAKAVGVVLLASVVVGLGDPGISAALSTVADAVGASVPYLGPVLATALKGLVVAGVAGLVEAIRNAIKHLEA